MTDARYIADSNIPTAIENKRLDDLTAYNSTILAHLQGDRLELALLGHVKRRLWQSDADIRKLAIDTVHPDDLAETLITRGFTLTSLGITSITLSK